MNGNVLPQDCWPHEHFSVWLTDRSHKGSWGVYKRAFLTGHRCLGCRLCFWVLWQLLLPSFSPTSGLFPSQTGQCLSVGSHSVLPAVRTLALACFVRCRLSSLHSRHAHRHFHLLLNTPISISVCCWLASWLCPPFLFELLPCSCSYFTYSSWEFSWMDRKKCDAGSPSWNRWKIIN